MAISVAPEAVDLLCERDRSVLLVADADDPDAAHRGLEQARASLVPLGPALLSPVVHSPAGPLLLVADLPPDDALRATVPDLVADALATAGVASATVRVAEAEGPLDRLDRVADAVVLRIFPVPGGPAGVLPLGWLEVAAEWVLGDLLPVDEVQLRLLGAPFTVRAADASAWLYAAATARAWCDLVQGDLGHRVRTASLTFGHAPHLALAAGGPGCDTPALLARYDLLCEVAREVADGVAYACVDFEPTFELLGLGLVGAGWPEQGGARPNAVAGLAGDVVVPDAFPFQVLGPGHAERLAQLRRSGPLGRPLGDGRAELELGDPVDWLPAYEERDDAVEQATKALEGLLVTESELAELAAARPLRPPLPARTVVPRGGLDLADVTLEALPHARRGLRLTLLELVSWLAREPHSDSPTPVSPVLAGYARWLASGLDHERRQALKPYAERLVGTRTPGLPRGRWRPLATADESRTWRAADWLVRHQAVTWLQAVGADEVARALAALPLEPRRAHVPEVLAHLAAGIAELLAGGGRAATADATWEAWERAAEATGWVAASEAARVGVPEEVAAATELRVAEEVRRRRSRAAPPGAVVEAARAAGVAAIAEAAWRAAGRAGSQAVDAMAEDPDAPATVLPVSLATAYERACRGVANRHRLDRDALDDALEQADVAARARLGELVGAAPGPHVFDEARQAAATSAGGQRWLEVQATTADMLGEEAWDTVLVAARTAVGRVLHHAEPLLARAMVVALAREAGGLAARVLASTGSPAALDPVVVALRPQALALLDDLIDVG